MTAQLVDHRCRFHGNRCLRGERTQQLLVRASEAPFRFVQHFKDAENLALQIQERCREQVACVVAGMRVHARIETWVTLSVQRIDELPAHNDGPGNAQPGIEPQDIRAAESHRGPQFVPLSVQKEDAGPLGLHEPAGFRRKQVQQRDPLSDGVHLRTQAQDLQEFVSERAWLLVIGPLHWTPVPEDFQGLCAFLSPGPQPVNRVDRPITSFTGHGTAVAC